MISLKRLIEQNQEELIAGALRAYRASLDAMGRACLQACPALGSSLQNTLAGLQRQIPDHSTLEQVQQTGAHVEANLQQWGQHMAGYHQRKTGELKEILTIMAHTAEAVGDRDRRYSQQFTLITESLHSMATLDDLSAIRDALVASAKQLQSSVAQMSQDGDEMVSHMRGELHQYQTKLEEAERLATVDSLTGLQNRRGIEGTLAALIQQRRKFSIIMLDLNGFKQINDTYGHAAGDDILRQFASELRAAFRSTDDAGRWGGDEFIMVLQCSREEAVRHVERARKWVLGEYTLTGSCPPAKVSVDAAIGIAEWRDTDTMEALLERADTEMYRHKKSAARTATPA
ncbi:MAG: GGDEF domain-containing protein [Candidatus Solibacter sp.]